MSAHPVTRMRSCAGAGCPMQFADPHGGSWPRGYHSAECARAAKGTVQAVTQLRPRAPLVTAKPAKRPRSISPASVGQRATLQAAVSIVSGATAEALDPAHLCARGKGGCDDPLCVIPLTRAEHRAFDDGNLDILGSLIAAGRVDEIAHAVVHYGGNLPALLQRLTGVRWAPVRDGQR